MHRKIHLLSTQLCFLRRNHTRLHSFGNTSTIFALSTPKGKGGIAVVRISGPEAGNVYSRMVRRGRRHETLSHSRLNRCRIIDPLKGGTIDEGMCVFFRGPSSFTTEDVLELHLHSGNAVIARTLEVLSTIPDCRHADPGEFTMRAFRSGRIDLTQVEGIKDLIEAETEEQRALAVRAAQADSFAHLEGLRGQMIECLAMVEAYIDFGEGEEIESNVYGKAHNQVRKLHSTIQSHLSDSHKGEIIRSGIKFAIFGPPNTGKSSLFNLLAQREAAIVTSVPGTTRDVLEITLDLGGMPVMVADTAGFRDTEDLVESIGIKKAKTALETADVSLCVLSLFDLFQDYPSNIPVVPQGIQPLLNPDTLLLCNKLDLLTLPIDAETLRNQIATLTGCTRVWFTSLISRTGIEEFLEGLTLEIQRRFQLQPSMPAPLITRIRHRAHLHRAMMYLSQFLQHDSKDAVLAAEELRCAAQEIGRITGRVGVEDVLDEIFKGFCIGK